MLQRLISAAIALVMTVSCAHSYEKDWTAFRGTSEYTTEKETFAKRLGGKNPCFRDALRKFIEGGETPLANCIYPSGPLKILQVQKGGLLVSVTGAPNVLFIRKTDERGLADGAVINADEIAFYEYGGVVTYEAVIGGTRTVHSFTKITAEVMRAQDDLKHYSVLEEVYAERGLWKESDKHMKRKKGDHTDYSGLRDWFWPGVAVVLIVAGAATR